MENIVIAGYPLEDLRKMQQEIKKEANKFISENIERAKEAMDLILTEMEAEQDEPKHVSAIESTASAAHEYLRCAKLVSDIAGVSYYLPYPTDWDEDGYYHQIECALSDADIELEDSPHLNDLLGILEDMEWESRNWHESRC